MLILQILAAATFTLLITAALTYKTITGRAVINKIRQRLTR
jgi:hypothetical protein